MATCRQRVVKQALPEAQVSRCLPHVLLTTMVSTIVGFDAFAAGKRTAFAWKSEWCGILSALVTALACITNDLGTLDLDKSRGWKCWCWKAGCLQTPQWKGSS
jgi:hypothetical protein